jgi:hypothetical protein
MARSGGRALPGRITRSPCADLIGLPELANLALQRFDPLTLVGVRAALPAAIMRGLAQHSRSGSALQQILAATERTAAASDRCSGFLLAYQPHCALAQLHGKRLRCPVR